MSSLSSVATEALRHLRERVARGLVRCPVDVAGLGAEGLGASAGTLASVLAGLDRTAVLTVLDAVLAERAAQHDLPMHLVWTGPTPQADRTRDTAVVVDELFARAERHVLVAGYAFDDGGRIFAPLHASMRDRGVRAELFVDVRRPKHGAVSSDAHATGSIDAFVRKEWPFGDPKPTIYFDPRTAEAGSVVSLHAKVVVVDERFTLIGSANFTDRAHTRNLEMGLLVDDTSLARRVVAHWGGLVSARLVTRYMG